jgi:hypothetical protein
MRSYDGEKEQVEQELTGGFTWNLKAGFEEMVCQIPIRFFKKMTKTKGQAF